MENTKAEKPNSIWIMVGLVGMLLCAAAGFGFAHNPLVSGVFFAVAVLLAFTTNVDARLRAASPPLFWIVRAFFLLWILIAVVKWMWFHS